LTLVLDGDVWSALPLGKEPLISIGLEAGWTQELLWTLWRREKSCTVGNGTPTIQPIAILTDISSSPLYPQSYGKIYYS
jgi:hypothetical protein